VLRNESGEVSLRPSACLSRLPVLRAYPSVAAAYVARRELQLELRLLALTGSFPNGSVFSVGARIGRGFRALGMFDDFTQALIAACDRELFPAGQGSIDLLTAVPVFTSAVQFRDAGRPGIPLLDWQGLNAEFFVLGHVDLSSKILADQEPAQDRRKAGVAQAGRGGLLISAA